MAKILQSYVKYTADELNTYSEDKGSCIRKINTKLHFSLGPYCLADFKHALLTHIVRRKVGYYDVQLEGIVLDIRNIKVLGKSVAMRADDARMHVDISADCYVFRPITGAMLDGVVKHIGSQHVGVIIYRVFNASIRFEHKLREYDLQMDQVLKFRIKKFNLQDVFPYIEGELVTETTNLATDLNESTFDSGIEERDGIQELDEMLLLLKEESVSETEKMPKKKKKGKKELKRENSVEQEKEQKPQELEEFVSEVEETPKKKKKSKKGSKHDSNVDQEEDQKPQLTTEVNATLLASEASEQLNASNKEKRKKSKKNNVNIKTEEQDNTEITINNIQVKNESLTDAEEFIMPSVSKKKQNKKSKKEDRLEQDKQLPLENSDFMLQIKEEPMTDSEEFIALPRKNKNNENEKATKRKRLSSESSTTSVVAKVKKTT